VSRIVDDVPVTVEPMTGAELRAVVDERNAEAFEAMYELVRAERQAAGKADSPIIVAAETARRLRSAG